MQTSLQTTSPRSACVSHFRLHEHPMRNGQPQNPQGISASNT
jgi:hypothetical protein